MYAREKFKVRFGQGTSPPEDWHVGDVVVRLVNPDDSIRVQAWRRGAFAVHETVYGTFHLTHVHTGAKIGVFKTGEDATQFADEVRGIFDWKKLTVGDANAARIIMPVMQRYKSRGVMI